MKRKEKKHLLVVHINTITIHRVTTILNPPCPRVSKHLCEGTVSIVTLWWASIKMIACIKGDGVGGGRIMCATVW